MLMTHISRFCSADRLFWYCWLQTPLEFLEKNTISTILAYAVN